MLFIYGFIAGQVFMFIVALIAIKAKASKL